ncbi:hypothetical protein BH23ACT11_BH23ACT11_09530 [soil metagenome]
MRSPRDDYRKKFAHEVQRISRRLKQAGYQEPIGDPGSGLMIVIEQPVGPRILAALTRSLEVVSLPDAYVTWAATGALLEELLALQPSYLLTIGPGAANEIDALDYPLSRASFEQASYGTWFTWTGSIQGLSVPSLAGALDDEKAKHKFWEKFLTLRDLSLRST